MTFRPAAEDWRVVGWLVHEEVLSSSRSVKHPPLVGTGLPEEVSSSFQSMKHPRDNVLHWLFFCLFIYLFLITLFFFLYWMPTWIMVHRHKTKICSANLFDIEDIHAYRHSLWKNRKKKTFTLVFFIFRFIVLLWVHVCLKVGLRSAFVQPENFVMEKKIALFSCSLLGIFFFFLEKDLI